VISIAVYNALGIVLLVHLEFESEGDILDIFSQWRCNPRVLWPRCGTRTGKYQTA